MFRHFAGFIFLIFIYTNTAAQCPVTVSAGPDVVKCSSPGTTQLSGSITGSYLSFAWTPTAGMTNSTTLTPTVSPTTTTTYTLTATALDASINLIDNGDFEAGTAGFSSDYILNPGDLYPEGVYDVLPNPSLAHPDFPACSDHTTGSGNMMAVNGSALASTDVWCQTVSVTPNTQYVFTAWATSLVPSSPARLQFSINGSTIGTIFNVSSQTCVWQNFYAVWNSGSATSATICIVNQNTMPSGNDFAIDDIVFSPTCKVSDMVQVEVVNLKAMATTTTVTLPCAGSSANLNGTGSSVGPGIMYQWTAVGGNIVSGVNTLNPVIDAPGAYTLRVYYQTASGVICEKFVTVNVFYSSNPLTAIIAPPPQLGCGAATVTLIGNATPNINNVTWQWSVVGSGHIVGSTTNKNCIVNQPGIYQLTATNGLTGCTSTAQMPVTAETSLPIANASSDTITCVQSTATLSGVGSSTGAGISYQWSTPNGSISSGQNSQNAVAGLPGTYILAVTNTANACVVRDTVVVISNKVVPYALIDPPPFIDCDSDTVELFVHLSPPPFVLLIWTAENGGNIASGQYTPQPSITAPGTYILQTTDPINGCISVDTVGVISNYVPPVAASLPADSLTCQQTSVILSGTGSSAGFNFGYEWSASAGGNIVSGGQTLAPQVNAPGLYTLTVLDYLNGCTATSTVTVAADIDAVTAVAHANDTLDCSTFSLSLNTAGSSAGPTFLYAWTTDDGNILNGANTPGPLVSAPGVYELTMTNTANGCLASSQVEVLQDILPPAVQIIAPNQLTCAVPIQSITANPLSPGANYTYSWTAGPGGNILSGNNTAAISVNAAATYQLQVTGAFNGCTANFSAAMTQEAGIPVVIANSPGPLTCSVTDQTLSSTGSSVGSEFAYSWSATNGGNIFSGATSASPVIDAPGTYILQILNQNNGCSGTDTLAVTENILPPVAEAGVGDTLTCTQTAFTLTGNENLPSIGLSFQWNTNGGHFTSDPNNLSAACDAVGTYVLLVTDNSNGCMATDSLVMTENRQVPDLFVSPPFPLTCLVTAVNLSSLASGSTSVPPLYHWQTVDGNILNGDSAPNPLINAPGAYALTVTDPANGCSASTQVEVLQDILPPAVQIVAPNQLTCAILVQSVTATPLSPGVNYTYNWTAGPGGNILSGNNTPVISVNAAATYQLQVTGALNGCTATFSAAVTQEASIPMVIASTPGPLTCSVTNRTLSSTGSSAGSEFAYSWSATNGGSIFSGATSASPVIDAPGTYVLQILNQNNGCSGTDTLAVTENILPPVAEAGVGDTLTCTQTEFTLTGNENLPSIGLSFQWNTNGGHFTSDPNNVSATCDAVGTYVLLVTDNSNGCTAADSLMMIENRQVPDLFVSPPFPLTCLVTAVNLNSAATGSTSVPPIYHWQTIDGNILNGDAAPNPLIDAPGTYALTVTDPANGCTKTGGAVVFENTAPPFIAVQPAATITCTAPVQMLQGENQAAGIFSYAWTVSNGGHIASGDTTLSPTVDAPGRYMLTAINVVNGCQAQDSLDVLENVDAPLVDAGTADTLNCVNNNLIINGSASGQGTLAYQWTATASGNILAGANTLSPTVNTSGWYALQVTDQLNGCQAKDSVQVFQDANIPLAEAGQPMVLTCQTTQTILQANASTGNNFTYLWTTNDGNIMGSTTTLSPSVDAPGTYLLAVTNTANGCIRTDSVLVSENLTPPELDILPADQLTCTTVSLQLSAETPISGGVFGWISTQGNIVSGGTTANPTINLPGAYVATLTDPANGCSSLDSVIVGSNTEPPVLAATTPVALTCAQTERILSGTITQPLNNFSVHWTTIGGTFVSGQNTTTPTVSDPGTYQMNVLDQSNGCNAFISVLLTENMVPPVALAVASEPITCDETVVSLNSTGSSTGTNITFSWSGPDIETGATTASPEVSGTGIYTVTVTNLDNGCVSTATATVTANTTPPVIAIAAPATLTCTRDSVLLDAGASSQGAGFQASWTSLTGHFISGQNSWLPVVDQAAAYVLTIVNTANGCVSSQTVNVAQNITPPGASIEPAPELNCNLQEIDLAGNSSASNASFVWTTDDGLIATGAHSSSPTIVAPGTYRLLVTNPVNGCTSTALLSVGEVPSPEFSPMVWQPDCHLRTGAIDFGSVAGGNSPFVYSINAGQSYQTETSYESLDPGIYELVVQDNDGCTAVETMEITAPFFPEVTLDDLNILALGESVQLVPLLNIPETSVASWEWSPAVGLSCSDCPSPTALPVQNGMYTLIITDLNGCIAEARTQLRVNTNRVLYPPNVISPNGDGKGDFFNLFGKGVEDVRWLRIYDRWGNQLYDVEHLPINEEMQGWNGVFRGQPVNPGVFVWQAMVTFIDGVSEIFSGDITVVR